MAVGDRDLWVFVRHAPDLVHLTTHYTLLDNIVSVEMRASDAKQKQHSVEGENKQNVPWIKWLVTVL